MGKGNTQYRTELREVQQWSGPLPAPESLARYNAATPDAAERIIAMAEKEQKHRHEMESYTAKRESRLAMTSIVLAFVCVLVLSGLVVYSIYADRYGTALATIFSAMAAVVGLFGVGKYLNSKRKE